MTSIEKWPLIFDEKKYQPNPCVEMKKSGQNDVVRRLALILSEKLKDVGPETGAHRRQVFCV